MRHTGASDLNPGDRPAQIDGKNETNALFKSIKPGKNPVKAHRGRQSAQNAGIMQG
jgi:hypothetical protein